jgi:DsbC/DsbD-like thiol-disulfide interchange protein
MITMLTGVLVAPLLAATPPAEVRTEFLDLALLAAEDALVPGRRAQLGIRLRHAPHWHTYWVNPGDSGLPTEFVWQLPPGYRAAAVEWPTPTRFVQAGIVNFGYTGEILLPVAIEVPANAPTDTRVPIAVTVKWLVCREECIPGRAELGLELPVRARAAANAAHGAAFAAALRTLPRPVTWPGSAQMVAAGIEVDLHGVDPSIDPRMAFVAERRLVNSNPPQIRRHDDTLVLTFGRSEFFTAPPEALDLVLTTATGAFRVRVPFVANPNETTIRRNLP